MSSAAPVVVEVERSGFVEGIHQVAVAVLDAGGSVLLAAGDIDAPVFPRSSVKPLQALAMVRAGLDLDGELLALAAASHSGEPFHLDGVRAILARAGLAEQDLRTPPDWPLDDEAMQAAVRAGQPRSPIMMNCSGKHAAMMLTCSQRGWPVEDYRHPDHPLQQDVRAQVERLAGPVRAVGVDGCGAALFSVSLRGLAAAFAALTTAEQGTPERRVADAMRAHPEWVGGSRREVTALMRGVPGLLAKDGAEGVYAAALPDGRAVALKVHDGAARARGLVLVAALRRLGVTAPVLDEVADLPLLGAGRPVGALRVRGL